MKTLLSLMGGALVLTEQGGLFTLTFDDKLAVGGGKAAGVVSVQGQGSIVLSGKQAFDLLAEMVESHVPAPAAAAVAAIEAVADAAIAGA
jgi:hypothetical protein